MTRARLPNRRRNETVELDFGGIRYAVTIGFYADGRVGEIFAHGAKIGSAMDAIIDDACVMTSLLIQHGVTAKELAASLGRHSDGGPSSIVGALVDRLAEIAEGNGHDSAA